MEAGDREVCPLDLSGDQYARRHRRSCDARGLAAGALSIGPRRFAAAALAQGDQVIVFVGDRATAVLPDGEQELGRILPGDRIATLRRGSEYRVEVQR